MFAALEKMVMGEPIPQETIDIITALRAREIQVRTDINAITDAKTMKKFKFDPVEIEQSKKVLKAGRKL
jgi:hypothetical protein